MILEIVLYTLLAVFLALVAVIIIRTLAFKPVDEEPIKIEEISFDKESAVKSLQALLQCKTISDADSSKENDAEFDKLTNLLPTLYPNVYKYCELKTFPGRALLFKWKGKTDANPSVLMSHYDVVTVAEECWQKPPFAGIIEDGVLWGRGALDTKCTFNSTLFAVNHLIGEGFTPNADIYLAFSGGEEVNGPGARNIVDYFEEIGVTPELVIDEGGAVVDNVFPGVKEPCALVGIAEKGYCNVSYTAISQGGHASAPKPNSPIVSLSKAVTKVENTPAKMHLTEPVAQMFDVMGRRSTFLYKMIFANLWLFKGVLDLIAIKSGGEMNALLRTTVAFTQSTGSDLPNVIPPKATVVSNIRINPMDTIDSTVAYLKSTIDNEKIDVKVLSGFNPSRISRTDVEGYQRVKNAIKSTFDNVLVSPYLMVQCSDSREYGKISDRVYRFSSMAMSAEERATIHGNNERIRLSQIEKSVEFYIRLIKSC